jgi:hypothetical protein
MNRNRENDTAPDGRQPGSVDAAQDARAKTQERLGKQTMSARSQATASKRQSQQEVHKGVGLKQRTARNTDRGSGRD